MKQPPGRAAVSVFTMREAPCEQDNRMVRLPACARQAKMEGSSMRHCWIVAVCLVTVVCVVQASSKAQIPPPAPSAPPAPRAPGEGPPAPPQVDTDFGIVNTCDGCRLLVYYKKSSLPDGWKPISEKDNGEIRVNTVGRTTISSSEPIDIMIRQETGPGAYKEFLAPGIPISRLAEKEQESLEELPFIHTAVLKQNDTGGWNRTRIAPALWLKSISFWAGIERSSSCR